MAVIIGDSESEAFYTSAYNPSANFNDRTLTRAEAGGGYTFRYISPPATVPPASPSTYKRCAQVYTYERSSGGVYTFSGVFSLPRLESRSASYLISSAEIATLLGHFGLSPSGAGRLAIYVVWFGWRVMGDFSATGQRWPRTYPLPGEANSVGTALAVRFKNFGS